MADNQPVPVDRLLTITLDRWRDEHSGRFLAATDSVTDAQRLLAQGAGELLVKALRDQSPRGKEHREGTPRFADSWRAKVTKTQHGADLNIDNTDPKRGYVIFPTRDHEIAARRVHMLRFTGRSGVPVFRRRVHHPGTKGNDVLGRVLAGASGPLTDQLQRHARVVQQTIVDVWK